jgi:hypothetical protein
VVNNLDHAWKKRDEFFGVFSLSDAQIIGSSLESGQFDVESGVCKTLLEDASQVCLILHKMVHDVREKSVEDLEGSINKARLL